MKNAVIVVILMIGFGIFGLFIGETLARREQAAAREAKAREQVGVEMSMHARMQESMLAASQAGIDADARAEASFKAGGIGMVLGALTGIGLLSLQKRKAAAPKTA